MTEIDSPTEQRWNEEMDTAVVNIGERIEALRKELPDAGVEEEFPARFELAGLEFALGHLAMARHRAYKGDVITVPE